MRVIASKRLLKGIFRVTDDIEVIHPGIVETWNRNVAHKDFFGATCKARHVDVVKPRVHDRVDSRLRAQINAAEERADVLGTFIRDGGFDLEATIQEGPIRRNRKTLHDQIWAFYRLVCNHDHRANDGVVLNIGLRHRVGDLGCNNQIDLDLLSGVGNDSLIQNNSVGTNIYT